MNVFSGRISRIAVPFVIATVSIKLACFAFLLICWTSQSAIRASRLHHWLQRIPHTFPLRYSLTVGKLPLLPFLKENLHGISLYNRRVAAFVLSVFLIPYFIFLLAAPASAAPTTMNFQGRLADTSGNIMPDGLYNMQFRLFTVSTGGTATWTETRETTNRVQVTNGLFSTQLGAVTPITASLFSGNDVYFEITMPTPGTATCGTASCASWESPMTPRQKMATSAYAFQAENANTLDGLDSTAFAAATGSANYIQNTTSPQTGDFNITGTGTAATLQATTLDRATAGTLTIGGTNATGIT